MTEQNERLRKLEQRRAKLNAEIQRVRAREQAQKRKEDTRRKVLIGAAVLAQVESGHWTEGQLGALMDSFLERERDRSLFGLPTNQTNEA